jgi:ABC-2 type transport system permease protein
MLLACTFSLLMSISLFWTLSADGIANLFPVAVFSLSGIVLPLPLFPDWMQGFFKALPFRGVIDVPFRIYMGHIPSGEALTEIGIQALWVLALSILVFWLLSRGLKRVVVQGG